MKTGAIFDVDGTLLDSMGMWEHAAMWYLAGKQVVAEPELHKKLFTFTLEESAVYLKKAYALSDSVPEIMTGINETIAAFYRNDAMVKPGIPEFLEFLKRQDVQMTVATATDREHIEAALKRTGIDRYFSKIFTCTEVGIGKERPDIYMQAARYMKTPISCTWVFEDAYHAAETAYKAGFSVCGVYDASSGEHVDILKKCSHVYVDDTRELCHKMQNYIGGNEA